MTQNPMIPPAMIGPNIRAETTTTFGPDCPVVFCAIYTMLGITATPAPTTAPITVPTTLCAAIYTGEVSANAADVPP